MCFTLESIFLLYFSVEIDGSIDAIAKATYFCFALHKYLSVPGNKYNIEVLT